jgi:hypothetical protein
LGVISAKDNEDRRFGAEADNILVFGHSNPEGEYGGIGLQHIEQRINSQSFPHGIKGEDR